MIRIRMISLAGVCAVVAGNIASPPAVSEVVLGPKARFLSANSSRHFAWWEGNTVSSGTSQNHLSDRQPYPFSIRRYQKEQRPPNIGELLSISSNDTTHFAWWLKEERNNPGAPQIVQRRLVVCTGPSNSLGSTRDWYWCRLPFWVKAGMLPQQYDRIVRQVGAHFNFNQIRFITSNNKRHFLWYEHRGQLYVFQGSSDQFDARTLVRCSLPGNVFANNILYIASNDQMHFAFLRDGTYSAGSSDNLAKFRTGVRYDLEKLQGR